jgi:alkanesulfonate monooxygenase
MTLDVHWFLPTSGDGRNVAPPDRAADIEYLSQVARAADRLGFTGVLTPTGAWCEDAWLSVAALVRDTERLKFLVAFRPGFVVPALAAHMAATLQRISRGRLLLNVVTGGDAREQRAYGDFLSHDERYERTAEFLQVVRRFWEAEPFDYDGKHYRVEAGGLRPELTATPPVIYFGGASPAAEVVAAENADVYLLWGEPVPSVRERVERMRKRAADAGRELRFGIRLHVITRDTDAQAWAEADRLLAAMDPEVIAKAQKQFAGMESVGQERMRALHGGGTDSLEIAPNLWAGVGLVRGGAGTALVGSHDTVAERISEYADLGLDTVILSGYPHLEEAFRVGEELLPRLGVAFPVPRQAIASPFVGIAGAGRESGSAR